MPSRELRGQLNGAFELEVDRNGEVEKGGAKSQTALDAGLAGHAPPPRRDTWSHDAEFLMSCIAMSVGLGNVWRFPLIAYDNGGGAFLIPYLLVLVLIGKPLYFLEMVMGQFSSKGTVKVYDCVPFMRGTGAGQTMAVLSVMSYYACLMAIIAFYLAMSFQSELPWSYCHSDWDNCYPSSGLGNFTAEGLQSSSELFFTKEVLRELPTLDNGLGSPSWQLTLGLLFSWLVIFLVLLRGVKSSGKAAYFLALFPYVVLLVLLVRAVTLPGAVDGIIYFIRPTWSKLIEPKVWFEAVTQCFFSLSVCFGNVIMYASYNRFRQKIYRDAMIVTSLDTFTSLLAGFTIFGILGNLAHVTKRDVAKVVEGGPRLAFISYPEAISKFTVVPQFFSVVFFLMLYVLGIGSNAAMASSLITVLKDRFPTLRHLYAVSIIAVIGFLLPLVYITPGGQWMFNLVDRYGASFIVYMLGICEVAAIVWFYGIRNLCDDIEFMLGIVMGVYWRTCWLIITPGLMIVIFLYQVVTLGELTYNGKTYPLWATVFGWCLSAIGVGLVPLFAFMSVYNRRKLGQLKNAVVSAVSPRSDWGPTDPSIKRDWLIFKELKRKEREQEVPGKSRLRRLLENVLGY